MGAPVSLLGQARAFARDYPRDQMPPGFLWDVVDFVPAIIDAPLTGRGAWRWGSNTNLAVASPFTSGILMPFRDGDQLLAATDANLYRVNQTAPYDLTLAGAAFPAVQNPIKYNNVVVHFDAAGLQVPQLWMPSGAPVAINAAHKHSRVGTTYKTMLVTGNATGEEHVVRFSVPGINVDLTQAASFDTNSFIASSLPITALVGLRSMILVFHAGSVERIRGAIPPHGDVEKGDMFMENLFDDAGTSNPRTVASWNDNAIFANENGVFITDGAVIKDLTSQGGISYYWRMLFDGTISAVGQVFLDYYMITVRHPQNRPPIPDSPPFYGEREALMDLPVLTDPAPRPPVPPLPPDLPDTRPPVPVIDGTSYNTTLICDLNRRKWFRVSNLNALTYFGGAGSSGMERVWAGISSANRLIRVGPIFYPNFTGAQVDDNGVAVVPRVETPWYRLGDEGRKRVRFAYLSYDVRGDGANTNPVRVGYATTPEVRTYSQAGVLPSTDKYARFRLPVNKFPYGLSFFVEATGTTSAVRLYDLAVEAQVAERSRV